MNHIVCPDCIIVMKVVDLLTYYCSSADLIVNMHYNVCLKCGNSSLCLTNVKAPEEENLLGRIETVERTCEYVHAINISQDLLMSLIKNYYRDVVIKLCQYIHRASWRYKFEIDLWDVLYTNESDEILDYEELKEVRKLASKTKLWLVNSAHWLNLRDGEDNFVSLDTWQKMYKNQKKLLRYDNVRDTKTNTKSGS